MVGIMVGGRVDEESVSASVGGEEVFTVAGRRFEWCDRCNEGTGVGGGVTKTDGTGVMRVVGTRVARTTVGGAGVGIDEDVSCLLGGDSMDVLFVFFPSGTTHFFQSYSSVALFVLLLESSVVFFFLSGTHFFQS